MAHSRTSLRLLVATAILSLIPLGGWWSWKRSGPLTHEATLLVKKGTTVDQLAEQLESRGIIRSAALFKFWARSRRLQLIRGEYSIQPRASLSDVAGKLRKGDIHFTNVVITPSMNAWSVQRRLKGFVPEDVFWTLWKSPRLAKAAGFPEAQSLEGLVAPATYRLHRALEPEEILLQMAEAFRMVGAQAEKVHLKQLAGQCPDSLKRSLEDYDVLALPGGFSAGDYVRAGAIFAARIKAAVGKDLPAFVEAGKPVLVDPKGDDYRGYRGATVLTPNRSEFRQVAGRWSSEQELADKAQALRRSLALDALMVTRSEEGMTLFREEGVPLEAVTQPSLRPLVAEVPLAVFAGEGAVDGDGRTR